MSCSTLRAQPPGHAAADCVGLLRKRAGLDYWAHVDCRVHPSFAALSEHLGALGVGEDSFFFVTKFADTSLHDTEFAPVRKGPVALVFGSETRGLRSIESHAAYRAGQQVGLPMQNTEILRSHNLSTSVAIVLWEAYRQLAAA